MLSLPLSLPAVSPSTAAAWLSGFGVCLPLIMSLGAQNLYVLRQAVAGRGIVACVAWCVAADALLITLGVAGMAQAMGRSDGLARGLGGLGAAFLAGYALFAGWRAWRGPRAAGDAPRSMATDAPGRRGWLRILAPLVGITLLNPHVYLETVVLVGTVGAQHPETVRGAFVAGAATASLVWFTVLATAGRRLQHLFAQPRAWRLLDAATSATMLILAWQMVRRLPA